MRPHIPWSVWRSHNAVNGPTETDSACGNSVRPPKASIPVNRAQCFALVSQIDVASKVPLLVMARCPFAVIRLIADVVVHALDTVKWRRTESHVRQERSKSKPLSADANPAASVISEGFIARVLAALDHGVPYSVFWRFMVNAVVAVLGAKFIPNAAAAPSDAAHQLCSLDGLLSAAVALALPFKAVGSGGLIQRDDYQTAKASSAEVLRVFVEDNGVSHAVCSFQQRVWLGIVGRYQRPTILLPIISPLASGGAA